MAGQHALLRGLVDYAGLYPPAALAMEAAVTNYARYRGQGHVWMLGAFVVGASRLDEFEACAGPLLPDGAPGWPMSILLGPERAADLERTDRFRREHRVGGAGGVADVVALEARPSSVEEIAELAARRPDGVDLFLELPWIDDPDEWVRATAAAGARAKIRTGGVLPELIPDVDQVARFLRRCTEHGVGLKFTAGLHHPVRGEHPLTYEPDAPTATMHGFLNVFAAAAFLREREVDGVSLRALLEERDPNAFVLVAGDGLRWRDLELDLDGVVRARAEFARSFGSCSFTEPVEDLQTAEIL